MLRNLCCFLALAVPLWVWPAPEALQLPAEVDLKDRLIVFDLSRASLQVVIDPEVEPYLYGRAIPEDGPQDQSLILSTEGGGIKISRPEQAQTDIPRLALEVVVGDTQRLQFMGSDLEVSLRLAVEEPEDETERDIYNKERLQAAESQAKEGSAGVEITVEDSQIELVGVCGVVAVVATESSLISENSRGEINLALNGGIANIGGHMGALVLSGDGEFTLTKHRGKVELNTTGGSLRSRDGSGRIDGTVTDTVIQLDGWSGPVFFTASDTVFEAQFAICSRLTLDGTNLDVSMHDWKGSLQANLRGGSLRGSTWDGKATITVDGGSVDLSGIRAPLIMTLRNDASADLRTIEARAKVEIHNARLDLDQVRKLDLAAVDSEVFSGRVVNINRFDALNCELELDLTETRGKIPLGLENNTRAQVILAAPCRVQASGEGARLGDRVSVSGCDLKLPNQRRGRTTRGISGEAPVVLKVAIDRTCELAVRGR